MIIDEIVERLKAKGITVDVERVDVMECINKQQVSKNIDTNVKYHNKKSKVKNYLKRERKR